MNQPTDYFKDEEFNPHSLPTTSEIDQNLSDLHEKMNQVRAAWGKPMTVTSGLRSYEQQMKINPSAPKSHHMTGEAVDILDEDQSLAKWVQDNMPLMEHIGLWFEDFAHTPTWVHFQIVPPRSGARVFIP